jgi:hypothetical protein
MSINVVFAVDRAALGQVSFDTSVSLATHSFHWLLHNRQHLAYKVVK